MMQLTNFPIPSCEDSLKLRNTTPMTWRGSEVGHMIVTWWEQDSHMVGTRQSHGGHKIVIWWSCFIKGAYVVVITPHDGLVVVTQQSHGDHVSVHIIVT